MGVNTQNLSDGIGSWKFWKPLELPDVTLVHGDVQQYMAHKMKCSTNMSGWACENLRDYNDFAELTLVSEDG